MPAKRPCKVPGCPELVTKTEGACAKHRAEYERRRGTATQRGYDANHRAQRLAWASRIAVRPVPCARCGKPIGPGDAFDLDHNDERTGYLGPSCATCNRSAGGKAAHKYR